LMYLDLAYLSLSIGLILQGCSFVYHLLIHRWLVLHWL